MVGIYLVRFIQLLQFYTVFHKKPYPETSCYNFKKTALISEKHWYKQSTCMTKVIVNVQNVVLWPWRRLWVVSNTVNGLVHNRLFQISPDLNKSLLQFSQITNRFLIHALLHAAPAQWIRNWMAVHCVKNHFRRTYFDKFMLTCLGGPVFYETQCSWWHSSWQ